MPREALPTSVSLNVVDGTRQHDCVRSRAPYGSDVRWLTSAESQSVPTGDGTGFRSRTDGLERTDGRDGHGRSPHLATTDTTDNS